MGCMKNEPYNIKPSNFSTKEGTLAYNLLNHKKLLSKADAELFDRYFAMYTVGPKDAPKNLSRNDWIDIKHLVSFAQHLANDQD